MGFELSATIGSQISYSLIDIPLLAITEGWTNLCFVSLLPTAPTAPDNYRPEAEPRRACLRYLA